MTSASASTLMSAGDLERQRQRTGPRSTFARAALHCTPALFSINMGTGISSILLHNFPYPARWLEYLGIIVFVLNIVIFVVLLVLTVARFVMFRGLWSAISKHTVAGMFWGCFPMGFVTIVVSAVHVPPNART